MTDDVYRIKADVSQYTSAIDQLVKAHDKLLQAESSHAQKLSIMEQAEKGATHSIQGITKSGLAFTSTFKEANGVLTQTAAKLDLLKHKGGQTVSGSIAKTVIDQAKTTSTPQVVKIDKAMSSLDELVSANKYTKKELELVWKNVQLGISQKLEGELHKIQSVMRTLNNLTKTQEVKTITPDFSASSAMASSLARDEKYAAKTQGLRQKALALATANNAKLLQVEQKYSSDLKQIKAESAAALHKIAVDKRKLLKQADTLTGVRAQARERKSIEAKSAAETVNIATARVKHEETLLDRLNKHRVTYNNNVKRGEQSLATEITALHTKQEAAAKASLGKRLATFKSHNRDKVADAKRTAEAVAEATRVQADRAKVATVTTDGRGTVQQQINVQKAQADLVNYLEKNRKGIKAEIITLQEFGTVFQAVGQGNIQSLDRQKRSMDRLIALTTALRQAQSAATAAGGHSRNASIRESHALTGALAQQRQELVGVTLSWKTMFRMIVSQSTSRLLSGLISELGEAKTLVLDLSKAFARISTLDNTNTPLVAWQASVRELSANSGIDILDQAKASYEALSNQIGEGVSSQKFMI